VSISESVKLQSIAEAKSLGSEIVDLNFLFLGVVNVLKSLDAIDEDDELAIAASRIRIHEKSKELGGFRTPVFESVVLEKIPEYLDQKSLKEFGEQILRSASLDLTPQSSEKSEK
jgi:hypothetical protein